MQFRQAGTTNIFDYPVNGLSRNSYNVECQQQHKNIQPYFENNSYMIPYKLFWIFCWFWQACFFHKNDKLKHHDYFFLVLIIIEFSFLKFRIFYFIYYIFYYKIFIIIKLKRKKIYKKILIFFYIVDK